MTPNAEHHQLQDRAAQDRSQHLGDPVPDGVGDRHLARDHHGERDRRVDVAARDRADGVDAEDEHQAEREGDEARSVRLDAHHGRTHREEHQGERADELCDELALHGHLLRTFSGTLRVSSYHPRLRTTHRRPPPRRSWTNSPRSLINMGHSSMINAKGGEGGGGRRGQSRPPTSRPMP